MWYLIYFCCINPCCHTLPLVGRIYCTSSPSTTMGNWRPKHFIFLQSPPSSIRGMFPACRVLFLLANWVPFLSIKVHLNLFPCLIGLLINAVVLCVSCCRYKPVVSYEMNVAGHDASGYYPGWML